MYSLLFRRIICISIIGLGYRWLLFFIVFKKIYKKELLSHVKNYNFVYLCMLYNGILQYCFFKRGEFVLKFSFVYC